jgi:3-methylcrotonyl-CoA carboxylase alpha subunit
VITTLLIANRGEIALRITRTCARLGIRSIAVYSDADQNAPHVAAADAAIRIGPAPARESYLRPDAIIDAARRTGAQAVHPGYGFLSEQPALAELCAEAGLIIIGPSADRISAMGGKIGAKRIAARAGVPSVPGYAGDDQSTHALTDAAERIGFPVMVKASAGGGGRGMRAVASRADLAGALDLARQEAQAAFGDPALLIEKLVQRPRHLEVQIAGDRHANLVHLFERDCSVQRNHQKILEEAPAPNLDPAIRRTLLERGLAVARAIAYDNLGTVEFVLEQGQAEPWFLEMNTRLQVEHTVTEAITGLDLVEWQIRIACGEKLPLPQESIIARGHAIEARITAEQAEHGFRPNAGRIALYRPPSSLRVDSGVATGSEVTLFYDSLLAKAIAFGQTRAEALAGLVAGLRDFTILGPATTLPFLIDALADPVFAQGEATTGFLVQAYPDGWAPRYQHAALARATAAVLSLAQPSVTPLWGRLTGFRLLGTAQTSLVVSDAQATSTLRVLAHPDDWRLVHSAAGDILLRLRTTGHDVVVETDGRRVRGHWHRAGRRMFLNLGGEPYDFTIETEVAAGASSVSQAAGSGAVRAPMPGVIAEVRVVQGETVSAGQVVVVLESMKLFASLTADIAGHVTTIACHAGDTVTAGQALVEIDASEA